MTEIAVTIPQAAKLSGLSRSRLYQLFKTGEITPKKSGKRTLIMVEDLKRYLENLPVAA